MVYGPTRVKPDDSSSSAYWCKRWGITLAQLRIAASRVGEQPERVLADITGRTEGQEVLKPIEAMPALNLEGAGQPMLPAWLTAARASMDSKYLDY